MRKGREGCSRGRRKRQQSPISDTRRQTFRILSQQPRSHCHLFHRAYLTGEMNWTGGSLQRTKQANKGIVQKQKAYFARARTHLQNGPSAPAVPFRPDYVQSGDSLEPSGRPSLYGTGSVRHTGHPARPRHEREQRGDLLHYDLLDSDDRRSRSREGATPEMSRGGTSATGHVKPPFASMPVALVNHLRCNDTKDEKKLT